MSARGKFDGIRDVVRFNWPTYAATSGAALLLAATKSPMARLIGTGLFSGVVGSLAAVHLTYDRSGLYELDWLPVLTQQPRTLVLHAGLDDVSAVLKDRHSIECVVPVDILEEGSGAERSILRARDVRPALKATGPHDHSLDSVGAFDLALGFLSVHELRTSERRIAMFEQVGTALARDGRLVLVEHMRDTPNFLAFGWGALHFFRRAVWVSELERAGFRVESEQLISPFVRALTASVKVDDR